MRIFLSILICFFVGDTINAQCKFLVDKIDEFKKVRVKETDFNKVGETFGSSALFQLYQIDKEVFLKFTYTTGGTKAIVVPGGYELLIKTASDSVIALKSSFIENGTFSQVGGLSLTSVVCQYPISISELNILLGSDPQKIRFVYFDGNAEFDIIPRKWSKFREKVNCIVSTY